MFQNHIFNIEFETSGSMIAMICVFQKQFYNFHVHSNRCRQKTRNRGRRCVAVGVFNNKNKHNKYMCTGISARFARALGPFVPGPCGPHGPLWAGPLRAPWPLMGRALVGVHSGALRDRPLWSPWTLVGLHGRLRAGPLLPPPWALVGRPGLLWANPLVGSLGRLQAGHLWALVGRALVGSPWALMGWALAGPLGQGPGRCGPTGPTRAPVSR